MDQPIVSVWLITYNHEAYIAEAIEGVLKQETRFTVELIIGEDCSTDGTRALVLAYKQRYPDRITLYLAEHNMGMLGILRPTYALCRGKYIAMLDGDDYWTDPLKLQKQVDQLERSPAVRFNFHQVSTLVESTGKIEEVPEPAWGNLPGEVCMQDLLQNGNTIVTLSVLFRNDLGPLPEWYYQLPYPDLALYFLLLMPGGVGQYLSANMGIYRQHHAGWFSSMSSRNRYHNGVLFLEKIHQHVPLRYQDLLIHQLHHHYYVSIMLSLKALQVGVATKHWLRLGFYKTNTTAPKPKRWPHNLLLTGLKSTSRLVYKLVQAKGAWNNATM